MNHSVRLATTLAGIAAMFALQSVASANPGLLHKHARGAVGAPAMLPGQTAVASTATQAVAVQAVAVSSDGADPGAAATSVAGSPGSVAGCPVMPGPDGMLVAGVTVDGVPVDLTTVDVGSLPSGTVVYVMPPPGHHGGPNVYHRLNPGATDASGGAMGTVAPVAVDLGGVDPSAVDIGAVDSGMVTIMVGSPGFDPGSVDAVPPGVGGPQPQIGQGISVQPMLMSSMAAGPLQASSVQTTSAAAVPTTEATARAMAGGFPNRAVGLRADALGGNRSHGRGVPATAGSVVAVSGDDAGGAVVQAGGATAATDGTNTSATAKAHGGVARAVGGGQPAGLPASAAAPRWRDRIRFAWPGAK